jgi:hypothetical protein
MKTEKDEKDKNTLFLKRIEESWLNRRDGVFSSRNAVIRQVDVDACIKMYTV